MEFENGKVVPDVVEVLLWFIDWVEICWFLFLGEY